MFYLCDPQRPPRQWDLPANGLITVYDGAAIVFVGASSGLVTVAVGAVKSAPAPTDLDSWEDVVEVSLRTASGHIGVASLMAEPPALPSVTAAGPGDYRLRIHARGRDTAPDVAALEPVEHFLILGWPGPPADDIIHKQTDRYGAELRRSASAAPVTTPRSAVATPPSPASEATWDREEFLRNLVWDDSSEPT
jgi:hypothetical protein